MKKLIALLMALMLVALPAMAEEEAGFVFTTVDMEGNEVTEAIFADYDLTMVNIWATWCQYCLVEMQTFPQLKEMLPENANLITICEDAELEPELVKEILAALKANYTTLQADGEIYEQILGQVYGFPTTIFVDSEGKTVGDPMVGLPSGKLEEIADEYLKAVTLRLQLMGKAE